MVSDNAARNIIPATTLQGVGERLGYAAHNIAGHFVRQGIDLNVSGRWVQSIQEKAANIQREMV